MRAFHFIFAILLLLQTGFAAACHGVGDVHVICHSDGIETVYVETETQAEAQRVEKDCCPSFSLRHSDINNGVVAPGDLARPIAARHQRHAACVFAYLPPSRGPPASAVF